ncbi:MAG: hypothetical protein ACF8Q5_15140 [Phycisphaerales bacterium JB040]
MLKFLRKYQLIIMIIGGSLLMVVFLLEPVITRLAPTAANRTVATIGPNQTKVSAKQREEANAQFNAVRSIAPLLVSPYYIGLDSEHPGDHWFLLAREARANGLVGEAGEGRAWAPELAQILFQSELQIALSQGLQIPPDYFTSRQQQIEQEIPLRVTRAAQQNYYLRTEDDAYEALAVARGIMRLIALHRTAPRRSVPESYAVLNDSLEGVAADALLLEPGLLAASLPAPVDQQLQAHFERFRDLSPEESDLGIGYVLPPRVHLEYLKLDAQTIADAVNVDRVEISKRFQRNPDLYPDSLDAPVSPDSQITVAQAIAREIRAEVTEAVLVEADRAIRALLLTATRTLETNDDGTLDLPADWTAPDLQAIAQRLTETVELPDGTPLPLPDYVRLASSWMTADDLQNRPDLATASFRAGATSIPVAVIPQVVAETITNSTVNEALPIQIGVPYTANAASDPRGSRYYITVLDARPQSPAESIEEVGRATIAEDFKQVQAYEALVANADAYIDLAIEADLEAQAAAQDQQTDTTEDDPDDDATDTPAIDSVTGLEAIAEQFGVTTRPTPARNVVVRANGQGFPPALAPANTDAAREALLDAARERLDPLQAPGTLPPEDAYVSVPLPDARSLAIFRLIARRPLTIEQARRQAGQLLMARANEELRDVEGFADKFPFSFPAMKRRHQFVTLNDNGDPETESGDTEEAPASN